MTLKFQGHPEVIRIKASGEADAAMAADASEVGDDIKVIADAVHQSYIQATTNPF